MKKSEISKIWNNLLDFIWPRKCLGCQQEGTLCCQECLKTLKTLGIDYQAWNNQDDFYFDRCLVCLDYHNPLTQNLIKTFKYQYLQNINKILVDILAEQLAKLPSTSLRTENIIITNIPLHKKKKRQRGFDQTEVLAQALAKKINVPYLAILKRDKFTKAQAQLSKAERQKNVSDAFVVNNINFKTNKTIILIDDVATTGATLNQAAKVLKDNGFDKIIALTLAKN
ncbi:ComF family protein [bacterium]|jgi:competence protein ComFC|nr:ComF family protein [bacterium]MBT4649290.1 ComF family protein [bacterium]